MTRLIRRWPAFDEPSWQEVHDTFGFRPAIYRVILLDEALQNPAPVRRLLRDDPDGRLYIGMTAAAIQRFGGLRAAIYAAYNFTGDSGHTYTNRNTHPVGRKMATKFVSVFAKERLQIEIEGYEFPEHIPNDYVVRQHEIELIASYVEEYGEPPPLNDAR